MNFYKLTVAYDGTNYFGWQMQKKERTIAHELKKTFLRTFGYSCTLIAASRTDAGVHALGQVVLCKTDISISPSHLLKAWNNALNSDISIRSLLPVESSFHPFHEVDYKRYKYVMFTQRPLPQQAPYGWYYRYKINKQLLEESLQIFKGTHDFLKFATCVEAMKTTRTIDDITLSFKDEMIEIYIQGKSFIHHMIRRIVGAAVTVAAQQKYKKNDIERLLHQTKGTYCFQTAPACGLSLLEVVYKNKH